MTTVFSSEVTDFRELLDSHPEISAVSSSARERLIEFYREVLIENEIQNLTRLLSPRDFFVGHVLDAWELERSGFYSAPAFDLGTGVGSPGLIHALLTDSQWILCDSEAQKVGFLRRVVAGMALTQVKCVDTRAEIALQSVKVGALTSKAVGSVEKIFGWIGSCSTWNTLILFKGPKWDEEWESFLTSNHRRKLKIQSVHEYCVGIENKQRRIIQLKRT